MEVKLLRMTSDPIEIMWVAARTCYASKSPIQMFDELGYEISEKAVEIGQTIKPGEDRTAPVLDFMAEQTAKHWKLVKQVLDSGHQSIAEHISFTFAIEGISRACSHQLVRHRAGIVFSQQSQRYVEIKENYNELSSLINQFKEEVKLESKNQAIQTLYKLKEIASKYFTSVDDANPVEYCLDLVRYLKAVSEGMPPEDARQVLPNATKTNLVMTVNYRQLIHMCNLRLCTRAQKEIRELFTEIKKSVELWDERLASYLVPQCEVLGVCSEAKCCGRKPRLTSVLEKSQIAEDILSSEDISTLMERIQNPQVNEKLKQLLTQKGLFDE